MTNLKSYASPLSDSRPRYGLLDGLRGIAAFVVIWYHFGEGFATSPVDQMINHGYLAVDFFFVLSGFVLGYAYDNRWKNDNMTAGRFMLRRVIRLHPMVILSVILGAVAYLIQGSVQWDGTPVPLTTLLLALFLGLFLIPVIPGIDADVRGNGEMFPLNGPSWSLFFRIYRKHSLRPDPSSPFQAFTFRSRSAFRRRTCRDGSRQHIGSLSHRLRMVSRRVGISGRFLQAFILFFGRSSDFTLFPADKNTRSFLDLHSDFMHGNGMPLCRRRGT